MPIVNDNGEKRWECPHCGWEGKEAMMNNITLNVECPRCAEVISDDLSRTIDYHNARRE